MSPKECKQLSHVWLFATPWAAACQAPLSMEFSRQEYWKGLLLPSPGGLPDPEIKLWSPALQADSFSSEPPGKPRKYRKSERLPQSVSMENQAALF